MGRLSRRFALVRPGGKSLQSAQCIMAASQAYTRLKRLKQQERMWRRLATKRSAVQATQRLRDRGASQEQIDGLLNMMAVLPSIWEDQQGETKKAFIQRRRSLQAQANKLASAFEKNEDTRNLTLVGISNANDGYKLEFVRDSVATALGRDYRPTVAGLLRHIAKLIDPERPEIGYVCGDNHKDYQVDDFSIDDGQARDL